MRGQLWMANERAKKFSELVDRIKDALGTDEDGEALIEVARNAHRAEMELAKKIKDEEEGA